MADGIIYADMCIAPPNSKWGSDPYSKGNATYERITSGANTYKEYGTSTGSPLGTTYGNGEKKIIQLVTNNNKPRFKVLALSDYSTSTVDWSTACGYSTTTTNSTLNISYTWRIPSADEWNLCGVMLTRDCGLTTGNYNSTFGLYYYYWASTEYPSNTSCAWLARFSTGNMYYDSKTTSYNYRARLATTF